MNELWKKLKMESICTITRGASPRPIQEWIAPSGTPWVKISDATRSQTKYINETRECIKDSGRSHSVIVRPGDLILSNSATPGIPKFMGIEACIHDGWLLLRDFKEALPLFIYYKLILDRKVLVGLGNGSVFTNLKTDILKSHEIALPPIEDQLRIVEVLGSLDELIELNEFQMKEIDELAMTHFLEHWDGQTTIRIDEIGEVTMGQSPDGETLNEDGDGLVFYQGVRDFGARYPSPRVFCTSPSRMASKGDILIAVRAPVGDTNVAFESTAIGRGVASLSAFFPAIALRSLRAAAATWAPYQGNGTVFSSITGPDLRGAKVPHVINSELEALLKDLDELHFQIYLENQMLKQTRDELLPLLLSGAIKVEELAK